jgi:DNA-binding CsgD family transcriptional regulator
MKHPGDSMLRVSLVLKIAEIDAETHPFNPAKLDALVDQISWTPDLAAARALMLRWIGLAYRRYGAATIAAERFAESTQAVPNSAWSVFGLTELISLAESLNEVASERGFAVVALRVFESVRWNEACSESREGLLLLAQALARLRILKSACSAWDQYTNSSDIKADLAERHVCRGYEYALRLHTLGVIAGASGDLERADSLLTAARDSWNDMNFRWRAAEAQKDRERYGLDGDIQVVAAESARIESRSDWDILQAPPPTRLLIERLSQRDARILQAVLRGLNDLEIATECHISPKTVRNILHHLYGIFGVHKRSELIIKSLAADPTLISDLKQSQPRSSR